MTDIVLVPAVENWIRDDWKLKPDVLKREYPTVHRIYENCRELDAYKNAHWTTQPDTNVGAANPVFVIGGAAMAK
ncbi:hypothetical protein PMAA_003960 [Talaromyces marneffei ATCC 18224]|uniref:Uncharacterized protein n=1 Tax=Talaromyces marneffei (strain ATCC 18224 / CBS 334.59 / QM 7333) TaxID=441960 RepID=B6QT33_TALMQ|nr:hypothetical protein PMAA_003960 [Talaromyces marneffei ATCC 18224]